MEEYEEFVKIFNGRLCKGSNVVGYCHNRDHKGYISKTILKTHNCINKKCFYFEEVNPKYWEQRLKQKVYKQNKRMEIKNKEAKKENTLQYIRDIFKAFDNIYITAVHKEKQQLIITYIYEEYVDLTDAINILHQNFKGKIYLKAVASDEETRRKLLSKYHKE